MNLKFELIFQIKKLYWFLFRPNTQGVKCVLLNGGRLLMVRRKFGSNKWVFPGGAINPGETPEAAARREIKEDLGIELRELTSLGRFTQEVHHRMHCFSSEVETTEVRGDTDKILETKWFGRSQLPELTPISKSVIGLFSKKDF